MPKKNTNKRERLVAHNVSEVVWLRLKRLTSYQLCRKIIAEHAPELSSDILDRKAQGMSWSIRSALGYWDTKAAELNAKILSRYYALLQISIAEQIASNNPADDLPSIQRHTEHGHGLFTLSGLSDEFPENFLIGCLKSGHFSSYCKNLSLDLSDFSFAKRPRAIGDVTTADLPKLISLSDLLRRIPEFQEVMPEYLGASPLSFQIGHASRNFEERANRTSSHIQKTGQFPPPSLEESGTTKTYVAIFPHSPVTIEELDKICAPIKNIQKSKDALSGEEIFVGELEHPTPPALWWDYVDTYKSGYCGTSMVLPFWGTTDPFLLHLVILYAFSIIVRYLPERWHDIENGKYDHLRALLEHYLVIIDNVLPVIAVERLTNVRLLPTQPGSMNAPI